MTLYYSQSMSQHSKAPPPVGIQMFATITSKHHFQTLQVSETGHSTQNCLLFLASKKITIENRPKPSCLSSCVFSMTWGAWPGPPGTRTQWWCAVTAPGPAPASSWASSSPSWPVSPPSPSCQRWGGNISNKTKNMGSDSPMKYALCSKRRIYRELELDRSCET